MRSDKETGIDTVIELLTRLAAGDLDARGARTGSDEDLDAVIFGINMLAEELGAHHAELEQRVEARTRELEAARQEAMAATRVKSAFLATMSHEIRTPMNGVIGLTSLLFQTELTDTQRQYAEGLRSAGEALLSVIDDILDFSKLEAGMVDLDLVDFEPRPLLEGVAGLLASTAARKDLEIIAYCLPEVPARLVGDEGRLRQILLNLASNAVKFTDKGQVVLTARRGDERQGTGMVRFQVADTGVGIREDARHALFEPFTQADASTTRKYGGTGLGLAICRSLTETMGGRIGVESEEGFGSTFWFEVPLPVSTQDPQPERGLGLLRDVRVLVVDDNATNRLVLESQLVAWGLRADVAERPHDVLHLMRTAHELGDPYAVVLLDMCMPDLDGLDLAGLIHADGSLAGSRLVLMSSTVEVDQERMRLAGLRDSLTKPVRSAELRDRLLRLVAQGPGTTPRTLAPSPFRPAAAARGRVLVVEDNPVNQLVAEGLVTNLGYAVDVVENGAEALEALADVRYAAILMDCHMPVMDGYAATGEIRAREADGDRRVPIIAMTASATPEDRDRCLAAGMDDYVSKPVDVASLRDALARWAGADEEADGPALDEERLAILSRLEEADGTRLLPTLTDAFASASTALLGTLRLASESRDAPALRTAAQELRGAAVDVGAVRVAALAEQAERAAVTGEAVAGRLLHRLESEVARAVALLRDA